MMTSEDLGVRIIRPFQQYSVGRVIFPNGTLRQALIKAGFAEAVTAPAERKPVERAARRTK